MTQIVRVLALIIFTSVIVLIAGCLGYYPLAENISTSILSIEKGTEISGAKYDVRLSIVNHGSRAAENIVVIVTMDTGSSFENIKNITVDVDVLNPQETQERVVTFHSLQTDLKPSNFFTTAYQRQLFRRMDI